MMLRAALLVGTLLLAGCSAAPPEDGPDAGPEVITDPRDTSYLQTSDGSHIHDYWGGRDNVTVLDASGSAWSTCSGGCAGGMSAAWRRPEEGLIVPQGTRWVNGTFGFKPHADNDYTSLELWVKTAQDGATRRIGVIEAGVPFSIESTQERNDPPHYVLSLWQFEVVAKAGDSVTIRGDYTWDVEAVRGLPLVPYPPHPDRWQGSTELELLQGEASALLYYQTGSSTVCYGGVSGCPGRHAMPDGVVVPFDAARVEARLTSAVPGLGLLFHGADTWVFTRVEGRVDGLDTVFDIAIEGSVADSPYAPQSLWEFHVDTDQPQAVEAWTGTYTITVTAYK